MVRMYQREVIVIPVYQCSYRAIQVLDVRVPLSLCITAEFVPCSPRLLIYVVDVCVVTVRGVATLSSAWFPTISMKLLSSCFRLFFPRSSFISGSLAPGLLLTCWLGPAVQAL